MLRSLFGAFPAFPTRANTPFTPETLFDGLGRGGFSFFQVQTHIPNRFYCNKSFYISRLF